jgi:hypothetical protein
VIYRDAKKNLAARSAATVATLWATAQNPAVFAPAAGLAVAVYNSRAVALSDLALAEWLDAPPLGLVPAADDVGRLTGAFGTVLATTLPDEDPTARLDRLATAEPLAAAQSSWQDGLRGHNVDMWTRLAADDACEVCQGLAEGGPFLASTDMVVPHPTCTCTAEPVTND